MVELRCWGGWPETDDPIRYLKLYPEYGFAGWWLPITPFEQPSTFPVILVSQEQT